MSYKSISLGLILLIFLLNNVACKMNQKETSKETWKKEILNTEKAFAKMVAEEGLHKAFVAFADKNAVIARNDNLIIGKESIDSFYASNNEKELTWTPDFVDVSESGDLGYTYGKYTFTYVDKSGMSRTSEGVFHTVWKRQSNGKWKFVWD